MDISQMRPEVTSLIKSTLQDQGINNYDMSKVKIYEKGHELIGDVIMVTIKDNNNINRQLNMVIKAAFKDKNIQAKAPTRLCYQNEIYFYSHIYPSFENFDKEHDVSQTGQLVPNCLKMSSKENEEILIMENLKPLGFDVIDINSTFDDEHVELIFKTYGRFHAYSFAMRDQQPEKYLKIVEGLQNVSCKIMEDSYFEIHYTNMCKMVKNILIPKEDDKIIKKFEQYTGLNVVNMFRDAANKHADYSAILHGDSWSNNMMFQYESNKKPVDMRLIDWQWTKVGSPVLDLSVCLYSGASKKIFDHLDKYLKVYHESFSRYMRKLGSDPEKLFSFMVLKSHWRKYSRLGMITSLGLIRKKLIIKDSVADLTDGVNIDDLVTADVNTKFFEEEYSKRVRELLWHMHEIDLL